MMDSQENALEQDKSLAQGATEGEQNAVQAQDENVENTEAATEKPAAESSETVQQEASTNQEQSADSQSQEDKPQKAEASATDQNGDSSAEQPAHKVYASKQEVLERIKEIARNEDKPDKDEVEHLKSSFYRFHIAEREKRQKDYLEAGGDPEKYQVLPDDDEETFKAEMQIIKEKRAKAFQEQEAEKQANLQRKLDIIEKIKAMATSPEEANKNYNEFKELQKEFKEIKSVPPEKANEVWRNYQLYVEQFYDLLNLNREAREYDFKKNLEAKTKLCEEAEALDKEPDVVSAFHQLQELHAQYREIGPVAKDLREQIWARFKAASTVINKKHQQHFEELRAKEEENLAKKTELCEKVEALAKEENKGIGDWEKHSKAIIALQQEWKTIGFAPQKMNVKIFERFRAACDDFFSRKSEFFKQLKQQFAANAEKKRELIKKAQEMTDSTDWKATGDKFVALQKEWKTIGAVPKKLGDQLWNEFLTACNHFFDARNAAHAGTRTEEKANLQKKRDIIAQLKELAEKGVEDAQDKVQELVDAYNAVGHVPFKEKDKIFKEYHDVLDKIYSDLHVSVARRRLDNFKQNLRNVAKRGEDAVDNERGRLARRYEQLKQEIATYENNLGFLNISSKKGNSLVDEMNRKVQRLKDDAELVRQKIKAIDSQDNN
ncbi:DUF349 domain-containing protein [Hallella absiana]|uniref:DUF349 domain-containing protein n=1 Tax=Hallella absiana TaxID=2925336 RepID=UPI0021CA4926|nr:DUF349 domain-containing protein [Hallella absiana]